MFDTILCGKVLFETHLTSPIFIGVITIFITGRGPTLPLQPQCFLIRRAGGLFGCCMAPAIADRVEEPNDPA